jgi:GT2 family glycosyltransferase
MSPKVFIIILNWNSWSDTLECLESLKSNDYPNYQVVIIDNGSKEKPVVPSPEIKIIYNQENLGFAGGNNIGIKYALEQGADYVLLLNNDTVVSDDFLTKLVKAGESDREIGLLGPKIYFYPMTGQPDKAKEKIWFAGGQVNWLYNKGQMRGWGEKDNGQYDQPDIQETEYVTGCCLLIKREAVKKIGLMPEEYFLYYEDTDWSLAAQKAGSKCVFVPAARIWHKGSASSKEGSPSYIYYHVRNGLVLAQRYAPWYIKPFVHLDALWRIKKQLVKLIFLPKRRFWAKYILLGIKDFYLGRRGKYENWHRRA